MTKALLEPRIGRRDLVLLTRQLAALLDAGLPLADALQILGAQVENRSLRRLIGELLASVESGLSLSDALGEHPRIFGALYTNMVAAGEVGGGLDLIIGRLALFLEASDRLIRKVRGALIYPIAILGVAILAVGVMMIVVVPTFEEIFADAGVGLPTPTLIVIGASEFVQDEWRSLLFGLLLLLVGLRYLYSTPRGELVVDHLLLRLPIVGAVLQKSTIARLARTLGTLTSSGVPILEGLEVTSRTAGNRAIHEAISSARTSIAEGETISGPLAETGLFPPMVTQMIHVGEQTGALAEMLEKIADYYDDEVDTAIDGLLAALEPLMIIGLGLVIGGMIAALYLPIFDMAGAGLG